MIGTGITLLYRPISPIGLNRGHFKGHAGSISESVYPPSGTAGLLDKDDDNSVPQLYLNILYFDKDMNFITGDYDRSTVASTSGFEQLELEVLVPMEGYMLIYVSNEEEQANIAYFDDISITHNHSPVIQENAYYPFGLQHASSYQRSYSTKQNFKYNGFEEQMEWGVYDYQARYYDPALGKFLNIDPAADLMRRHSPYNYAFDNPIRFTDPDGMMPEDKVENTDPCKDGNCLDEVVVNGKKPGWMNFLESTKEAATNIMNKLEGVWNSLKQEPDSDDDQVVVLGSGGDEGAYQERTAKNTVTVVLDDIITLGGVLTKPVWNDVAMVSSNPNSRTVSNPSKADRAKRGGEGGGKVSDAINPNNNVNNNILPEAGKTAKRRIYNDSTLIIQTYHGKNRRGAPVYKRDTVVVGKSRIKKIINSYN